LTLLKGRGQKSCAILTRVKFARKLVVTGSIKVADRQDEIEVVKIIASPDANPGGVNGTGACNGALVKPPPTCP
jgi:hypothetical protein